MGGSLGPIQFINFTAGSLLSCVTDLDRKLERVDGVFRADGVCAAEVQNNLGDAVVIGQWSTADVDVVGRRLVERQSHVMSRVHQ